MVLNSVLTLQLRWHLQGLDWMPPCNTLWRRKMTGAYTHGFDLNVVQSIQFTVYIQNKTKRGILKTVTTYFFMVWISCTNTRCLGSFSYPLNIACLEKTNSFSSDLSETQNDFNLPATPFPCILLCSFHMKIYNIDLKGVLLSTMLVWFTALFFPLDSIALFSQ